MRWIDNAKMAIILAFSRGADNVNNVFIFIRYLIYSIKRGVIYKKLRLTVGKETRALNRAMYKYPDCDMAFEIVKTQARKINSKIEFAPNSGEFYITNDDDQFIILTAQGVRIINGIYHYDIQMSGESTQYLDKYIKRILERRRSKSKKFIETKIDKSLKDILHRVNIK